MYQGKLKKNAFLLSTLQTNVTHSGQPKENTRNYQVLQRNKVWNGGSDQWYSLDTQQLGRAPRSRPEIKMEEVKLKMARRRSSDAGDVRRHCKKNCSVLSCIGKRTKEGNDCDS